ncbi:PQQ-binding-like beta-propeller repeat protein [Bacillus marinisedimentorum]|uniref:outer membrane protein assembly factor BamB family protein n=1 Tax=Bacillus marinisedimentorum TaxID=1821260 RepID=UPI0007E097DE|nr:PQQ-binding-like beta-propeller repeat protein [Bacillus marinisedimentorum]
MMRCFYSIMIAGTLFLTGSLEAKAAFGPDEWLEYRLKDDNNAVYQNEGTKPLEPRIFETEDEVRSTPVVADNKIFIGNHNTGGLFAYDVLSGDLLWETKLPNWIHSEAIYHDNTVYVGFGNRFYQKNNGIRGTGESGVMALDAETGEIKWKANTKGEVMPTPVYHDGFVYAASGDRNLHKIDAESGKTVKEIELESVVSMSSPNLYEGNIFLGGSVPYSFYSVDLSKEQRAWERGIPEAVAGLDDVPPAIHNDIAVTTALDQKEPVPLREVYENFGAIQVYEEIVKSAVGQLLDKERMSYYEHMIYALDTESGEIVWKDSLGTGTIVKNNKSGAPMIYDGKVFLGSPITKQFYAYDLENGDELWKFENEVIKAPPVAADGIVYFSNAKGYVHAMDAGTGEEIGRKKLGGTLAPSGPIIINDTLFIGSQDSNVYALPTENIRSAADEYHKEPPVERSAAGYIFTVYVLPIVIVLSALGVLAFYFMRRKRSI